MAYPLFTRVSLAKDFPEQSLHRGDLATIVEIHEGGPAQETGYSLEVFNAVGETIAVLVVEGVQNYSCQEERDPSCPTAKRSCCNLNHGVLIAQLTGGNSDGLTYL